MIEVESACCFACYSNSYPNLPVKLDAYDLTQFLGFWWCRPAWTESNISLSVTHLWVSISHWATNHTGSRTAMMGGEEQKGGRKSHARSQFSLARQNVTLTAGFSERKEEKREIFATWTYKVHYLSDYLALAVCIPNGFNDIDWDFMVLSQPEVRFFLDQSSE